MTAPRRPGGRHADLAGDLARGAWLHILADMRAANSSSARSAVVRQAVTTLGVTPQTVYRQLATLGWTSGRATRRDAGTSVVTHADLEQISAMVAAARNKRGQANLPMKEGHRVSVEQGLRAGQVSYGHLTRLLKREGLDLAHIRAPETAVARVSLHPNQVWFFDISVAIQWYFRDPETGKRLNQYDDAGARFYDGKRQNMPARVIHRFAITDHYSGAYFVRYYYSAGERAEDVVDFLERAMAAKELARAYPLRGRPFILVMDQGSANKSALVVNLLEGLDVRPLHHAPKNAKASGSVETRHNHWQRSFEGRLRVSGAGEARDLDELNGHALRFCAQANSDPSRANARHGRPPMAMWATILPEQLREAPSRAVFLQLASSNPRTGTLDAHNRLRADKRKWEVGGEHVHAGQKVRFRISPFLSNGVRVWDEHGRELTAEEIQLDPVSKFPLNGRLHVFDDPEHKGATAPKTPGQLIARAIEKRDGSAPLPSLELFGDDLDRRIARLDYLSPAGTAWSAPASEVATEPLLSHFDVRQEIANRLGRGLSRDEAAWWREAVGVGVTASRRDALFAEFTGAATPAAVLAGRTS